MEFFFQKMQKDVRKAFCILSELLLRLTKCIQAEILYPNINAILPEK